MPVAARAGHVRARTGPRDPELRHARCCYDHLAGDLAVAMFDGYIDRRLLSREGDMLCLTRAGRRAFAGGGIDVPALEQRRRPLCRGCLDWSERRTHLGGALGAALFDMLLARQWAVREPRTRIVRFTAAGDGRRGPGRGH
jgi:hypothetical protein